MVEGKCLEKWEGTGYINNTPYSPFVMIRLRKYIHQDELIFPLYTFSRLSFSSFSLRPPPPLYNRDLNPVGLRIYKYSGYSCFWTYVEGQNSSKEKTLRSSLVPTNTTRYIVSSSYSHPRSISVNVLYLYLGLCHPETISNFSRIISFGLIDYSL